MLCRFVRHSKTDPLVDEVQLMDVNPSYAYIRYSDGRESTVSLKDYHHARPVQKLFLMTIPFLHRL